MKDKTYFFVDVLLSMLSKHVEHNRWPFLVQNVFVERSISFRQIKHLNIGDIFGVITFQEKKLSKNFKKNM